MKGSYNHHKKQSTAKNEELCISSSSANPANANRTLSVNYRRKCCSMPLVCKSLTWKQHEALILPPAAPFISMD